MTDFSDLQPWVDSWGLASAHERLYQRVNSNLEELQAFYDAVSPHLEELIEYLNQFGIDEIPLKDQPLAWMTLALCEVDDALHVWQKPNLDYISDPVGWRIKTSFTDYE